MTPYTEGELLPEDFYESLTNGGMQLWVAVTENEIIAAMVTQVIPYPRKNVLRIICIGGQHMDKWLRFFLVLRISLCMLVVPAWSVGAVKGGCVY